MKNFKLFLLLMGIFGVAHTQDIQFSQFYAAQLFQNPAFTGGAHGTRFIFHNRLQWPGINGPDVNQAVSRFSTVYFSIDHFASKYKSGFGLSFFRDFQGGSTLTSTDVGLSYAYEIRLSDKMSLRPGLQVSYVARNIDYSVLRFPDDFNDQTGWNNNIYAGIPIKQYADISSGMILYSDKIWGGLSVHHINEPNQTFFSENTRLPMKVAVTGGYKILLKNAHYLSYLEKEKEMSLTPTFHYKMQGKNDQFDAGLYFIYDQLMAGLWYRGIPFKKFDDLTNSESTTLLLGWKYKTLSIGYSYDLTVSSLRLARSGGAHELNITYVLSHSKKYKPMKRLPCPSFYKNH